MLEDITTVKFNKIRLTCCLYLHQDHILITIQNDTLKIATEMQNLETQYSVQ